MSALVAIVGSGPSGFYAAEALLQAGHRVDVYERLPVPFGLVRFGVAPDHPKLKSVTKLFEKIAETPDFRFFGNVEIGQDLALSDLRKRYDAVILSIGAEVERSLGIPGETLPGYHSARHFVGWYNGHPDYRDLEVDLSHERALVIGQGNVSLDVARILLKPVNELRQTDIADHALEQLAESRVREVHVLGRRGPAQARFTGKELREFGSLTGVNTVISPDELALGSACRAEMEDPSAFGQKAVYDLFATISGTAPGAGRECRFSFFRQPLALDGLGKVESALVARTVLRGDPGRQTAEATEQTERLACGLVVGCIGYRVKAMAGLELPEQTTVVPNQNGRVAAPDGDVSGLYVTGWAKRGPSGTIGTNRGDSVDTVNTLLADLPLRAAGRPEPPPPAGAVSFDDWKTLDEAEQAAGLAQDRPRRKVTRVAAMLQCVASTQEQRSYG